MAEPIPSPFRVIEEPFVVWSYDPSAENVAFLNSIDFEFYERTVKTVFCDEQGCLRFDSDNTEARKDVSSLARLLWNHGLETLVTLLGAYVQAPHAVHGFFLKCENKDCRKIAQFLLSGHLPASNLISQSAFNFSAFVRGIHARSAWANDEPTMVNFAQTLRELLIAYDRDDHRAEYNSIKHGLRATHGRSAIAIGLQESEGIPAAPEAMEMLSDSRDGSHFVATQTFHNLSKRDKRQQFSIEQRSVGWSLEKTLLDIQLVSCLIGNVVGALKVAAGALPGTVQFFRPEVDGDWWQTYFQERGPLVQNLVFAINVELPHQIENAEKQAAGFYRTQRQAYGKSEETTDGADINSI